MKRPGCRGHDYWLVNLEIPTINRCHLSTGFLNNQDTGSDIPRLGTAGPVCIKPPTGQVAEVQGSRSNTSYRTAIVQGPRKPTNLQRFIIDVRRETDCHQGL